MCKYISMSLLVTLGTAAHAQRGMPLELTKVKNGTFYFQMGNVQIAAKCKEVRVGGQPTDESCSALEKIVGESLPVCSIVIGKEHYDGCYHASGGRVVLMSVENDATRREIY